MSSRVFELDSGYAPSRDEETIDWLIKNKAITFYQTIIFPEGDNVDYYVFNDDQRAGTFPALDDRRK